MNKKFWYVGSSCFVLGIIISVILSQLPPNWLKPVNFYFMSSFQPNKITGQTNELAKERNRAAAERTLTAWIQNCLTLIGFGFAIDQIFLALEQKFPGDNPYMTMELTRTISLILIALSIFLLITAMVQHSAHVNAIKRSDYFYSPSKNINILVISTTILFGLVGFFIVVFFK